MGRKTADDLKNLVESVREKPYLYESEEKRDRNWHEYDKAQVNEIAEVIEAQKDVVDLGASCIPEEKNVTGRPSVPAQDFVKVMIM